MPHFASAQTTNVVILPRNRKGTAAGDLLPIQACSKEAVQQRLPSSNLPELTTWLLSFKSPHTVRSYRNDLSHWLAFCADHGVDPLEARRAHIDAWARVLESLGLKERSVGRRLSAVSSWYQYLIHDGVLAASPTQHVRRPKVSDEGTTPGLTRDELRRLLAAARAHGSPRSVALVSLRPTPACASAKPCPATSTTSPTTAGIASCAWSAKAAVAGAPCSPPRWSARWTTTPPGAPPAPYSPLKAVNDSINPRPGA
jgi:hypothetical protein